MNPTILGVIGPGFLNQAPTSQPHKNKSKVSKLGIAGRLTVVRWLSQLQS